MHATIITVRRSQSVVGYFNVFIEKGSARARVRSTLPQDKAIEEAHEIARNLQTKVETYLRHPDLNYDTYVK